MSQKILIIDDDLYIRELYQEIMKDAGFLTDTAVDGEDGLLKILNNEYNLILLDVMMPKLDGLSLLKKLSDSNPDLIKKIPIILVTNLSHDPILNEALSTGARSYIIKTDITPDKLIEKVKSYMS